MSKIYKNIEIVGTQLAGLSSMSVGSRCDIQAVLSVAYANVAMTFVNNLYDLQALVDRKPDMIFLGVKYIPVQRDGTDQPENIWLSEYLDEHHIAYTGSDHSAVQLECHKETAKHVVLAANLATAKYCVVYANDYDALLLSCLSYPVFIKPTNMGGGKGVDSSSLAYDFVQARSKIQSLSDKYGVASLVEEYLPGREFSVAIMWDGRIGDYLAMPIELIAPIGAGGERILSSAVKSADSEKNATILNTDLRIKVNQLAVSVFEVLGARDYGRIDIRLDAQGEPHFLEANLLPSLLVDYGNFPKACLMNKNLTHAAVILHIVSLAFARADYRGMQYGEVADVSGHEIVYGMVASGI